MSVTPWAVARIRRDYATPSSRPGVSKAMLRRSLADFPDTEFHVYGATSVLTVREARDAGIELLEVRAPRGDLIAAVYITADGYTVA